MEDDLIYSKDVIGTLTYKTPFFLLSPTELKRSIESYRHNFPNAEIYYAMKSNSEPEVLKIVHEEGCGFEVASTYELDFLKNISVPPEKIIYGTSVKPKKHIEDFVAYGVDRFAVDSERELNKIAECLPTAKIYTRVLVDDSDSVFTMSEKFGSDIQTAIHLLKRAKEIGLTPYGISFNVGSQARNADAWANGILTLIEALKVLQNDGIQPEVINLGGGFPQHYIEGDNIPTIEEIARHTQEALSQLPYPMKVFLEPGRGIVAHSMVFVVTVFEKLKRHNGHWLYLDGGAYNALLESMFIQGNTRYKVSTLIKSNSDETEPYILTGPTGDSLDRFGEGILLPSSIKVGDKLIVHDTGAYSLVLTTPFNGFPKPPVFAL